MPQDWSLLWACTALCRQCRDQTLTTTLAFIGDRFTCLLAGVLGPVRKGIYRYQVVPRHSPFRLAAKRSDRLGLSVIRWLCAAPEHRLPLAVGPLFLARRHNKYAILDRSTTLDWLAVLYRRMGNLALLSKIRDFEIQQRDRRDVVHAHSFCIELSDTLVRITSPLGGSRSPDCCNVGLTKSTN